MIPTGETIAGKRLLILDGTRIACEIVEHAKSLGVRAIVADYNRLEDSPAKQIADEHLLVSITDVDAVVELVRNERIDGIVAGFSDKMLPYYAEICRRSDLPCYGSVELFRIFTEKSVYKGVCQQFEVPTVEGYSVADFQDGSVANVRFPVIVKPSNGSGSRGIKVCHTKETVLEAIAETAVDATGSNVIIEQYLDGEEATVFWVFQDGEYRVSMLANRHIVRQSPDVPPLPVAYTAPSWILPSYLRDVAPNVCRMLESVGVKNGMMFMQGLIDDGVFRVYDIGYRLTGTQEYRLIEAVSGYNPLKMLIRFALTGRMAEVPLHLAADPTSRPYAYNVSVSMRPGTISRIEGISDVQALPGVVSVVQTRFVGDSLPAEATGQLRQITVRTLGVSDTIADMEESIKRITRTVRVISEDDVDLTLNAPQVASLRRVLL